MTLLRHITLRQKLILITLRTAATALLLASTVMFVAELTSFGDAIVRDISMKADIIGNQCTAALAFNVQRDAEETLGALQADKHIEYAAVYAKNGALFAAYRHENNGGQLPQVPPSAEGYRFGINRLDVMHPIVLHGERIGSIFIRSNLQNLYVLLLRFLAVAGIVLVISLLVAYALVSRLQGAITGPVTGLVRLMERISRDKDFSMRAEITGPDELSSLALGFNDMLSTIQERDRELERQATIDSLTGIFNRLKFNEVFDREIQEALRYKQRLSLIMFDIDHFKSINDTYGHLMGDTLLKEVVRLISANIRNVDIFSRWGGEEFVILSPNNELKSAQQLAEKLRVQIEKHDFSCPCKMTCSFGLTQFRENDTADSFIIRADDALYRAKGRGRNSVETG